MRVLVFLLALAGAGASGFLSYTWWQDIGSLSSEEVEELKSKALAMKAMQLPGAEQLVEDAVKIERRHQSWMFLAGAAVAGLLGAILVLGRRGIFAALLMIPLPIIAAYFHVTTLIFSGALLLAGCLAIFVWPKPKETMKKHTNENDVLGTDASVESAPQMTNRLQCAACAAILNTAKPVPVGKKLKCPKCGSITPIRALPQEQPAPTARSTAQPAPSAPAKSQRRKEEDELAVSGASALFGWFLFLLGLGGAGAITYLKLTTDIIDNFVRGS